LDLQRFAGERTEPATPRRREDARKKGQVARSGEIGLAVTLLAAFAAVRLALGSGGQRLVAYTEATLTNLATGELTLVAVGDLMQTALSTSLLVLAPVLLAVFVAGFAVDAAQVGLRFAPEALKVDLNRINPGSGFKRIFSRRAVFQMVKSVAKAALLGWVVYRLIRQNTERYMMLPQLPLGEAVTVIGETLSSLFWQVGLLLLVLAAFDYWHQRREFEESIKMTKQEVKQELRESEGDPQIRARVRERQRAIARRRMMQDVARADVVITNPTHFAVALRYEAEKGAPEVLGKGQGHVALRMRAVAEENRVPLVENPPLARGLHRAVEIGDVIPAEFYQAVAEVLAFVYRQRGRAG
jgi:flagellar biosynthetic protein FlhB